MITKELIGKTVYLIPTGNSIRRHDVGKIIEVKADKVGTSFITMTSKGDWNTEYKLRFNQENNELDNGHNSGYILFESVQCIANFKLKNRLKDSVRQATSDYSWGNNVTLQQLKAIAEILNIEVKQ